MRLACQHWSSRSTTVKASPGRAGTRVQIPRRVESAPSSSEVAVSRVWRVNPTRLACRKELDCDGLRQVGGAFVSNNVHVVATGIDKRHPLCVHVRLATRVVPFIGRHRSRGDDDQAMARDASASRCLRWPATCCFAHTSLTRPSSSARTTRLSCPPLQWDLAKRSG